MTALTRRWECPGCESYLDFSLSQRTEIAPQGYLTTKLFQQAADGTFQQQGNIQEVDIIVEKHNSFALMREIQQETQRMMSLSFQQKSAVIDSLNSRKITIGWNGPNQNYLIIHAPS